MGRVIVFGSINMDCVATVVEHPKPGETVKGGVLHYLPGGKGANQATASARLGGDTVMVGRVGKDSFGDFMLNFLSQQNMSLSHVQRVDEATGTALIAVNQLGENTIIIIGGANGAVGHTDIESVQIQRGDVLVCQNEISSQAMLVAFTQAKAQGATIVYNPAPAVVVPVELFKLADVVVMNELEHEFYRELLQSTTCTVVLTQGAKGVKVTSPSGNFEVDGHRVSVLDTTGAGDCFTGALACRLSKGDALRNAVLYANKAASLSVQRLGASASMPTAEEMDSLCKS